MKEHFRLDTHPIADPANIVQGEHHRITVLDAGLVRLEYSPTGEFEDRASQTVLNRAFPPCDFTVTESEPGAEGEGGLIEISTERFHLTYDGGEFTTQGLSVWAKGGFHSQDSVWRYGVASPNLGGTARTLDDVDGAIPLEDGIMAHDGIAMVDDSASVLLTEDGWITPRRKGNLDLYVFAYGRDYRRALEVLYTLTGPTPLLPRYALGNWWSRYHPYSADEYLGLMDKFAAEGIPFSVGVIDMDWHLVDIDPRYGSGWTGYTWNRELFPDPEAFLTALHERGLATSLNVHPAEGVHAHEAAYAALAKRVGIDPASETPVPFDPTDPDFLEAYFEELHHPLEDEGVDFWWLDWQQGGVTRVPGLDPLWLLNHFHFLDSGRAGKRPLTFSRYAGIGSHRYPIGFSGDTMITWESLDFQPYFTATASNAGYGWWSHDIGGHFKGYKDDELATRWVQLGVFSPINRLHSGFNPFNTKEPWRFGTRAQQVMTEFLRLRHQLLPYLATMNVRAHEGRPIVEPMYYEHPDQPDAWTVPNQFMFGTDLLVAPITSPADAETGLGRVKAWLPEGEWVDLFTGMRYRGGRVLHLHRDLGSIPVLARAGTILPVVPADALGGGTDPASRIELRVVPGADGEFTLVEDRDDQRWARTRISYDDASGAVTVHDVEGHDDTLPQDRAYDTVLVGAGDGDPVAAAFAILDRAQMGFELKGAAYEAIRTAPSPAAAIGTLQALEVSPALLGALTEVLLAR
ncbi:glycoside hydrolase family 31 protein [Pedococcus aerophilus]|uniref:Glycoside hydrolase family 31 protein n=1 Tax=Pedococcus aerophilus TaxID=436356 RepID=A0ABN3URJ8_9MICO